MTVDDVASARHNDSDDGSSNSVKNQWNDIQSFVYDVRQGIKDEDWHNIPQPVRTTCEGLLDICFKLGQHIVRNSEDIRFKKKITEGRMDDIHKTIKKRFDMADTKVEKETKKMRENMMKQHDEGKNANTIMQANNMKMQQNIGRMDDTLQKWSKKMNTYDAKIKDLENLASELEANGEKQSENFKKSMHEINSYFLVPGIIGPDKKNNAYTSFPQFIEEVQEFKESGMDSLIKVMDSKVKAVTIASEKQQTEIRSDMMDYLRLQETQIANLRIKLNRLHDDMDGLLAEQEHSATHSYSGPDSRGTSPRYGDSGGRNLFGEQGTSEPASIKNSQEVTNPSNGEMKAAGRVSPNMVKSVEGRVELMTVEPLADDMDDAVVVASENQQQKTHDIKKMLSLELPKTDTHDNDDTKSNNSRRNGHKRHQSHSRSSRRSSRKKKTQEQKSRVVSLKRQIRNVFAKMYGPQMDFMQNHQQYEPPTPAPVQVQQPSVVQQQSPSPPRSPRRERAKNSRPMMMPPSVDQSKRLDEVILHQMRFETQTQKKIDALKKLITVFSQAMFERFGDMESIHGSTQNTRSLQDPISVQEVQKPPEVGKSQLGTKSELRTKAEIKKSGKGNAAKIAGLQALKSMELTKKTEKAQQAVSDQLAKSTAVTAAKPATTTVAPKPKAAPPIITPTMTSATKIRVKVIKDSQAKTEAPARRTAPAAQNVQNNGNQAGKQTGAALFDKTFGQLKTRNTKSNQLGVDTTITEVMSSSSQQSEYTKSQIQRTMQTDQRQTSPEEEQLLTVDYEETSEKTSSSHEKSAALDNGQKRAAVQDNLGPQRENRMAQPASGFNHEDIPSGSQQTATQAPHPRPEPIGSPGASADVADRGPQAKEVVTQLEQQAQHEEEQETSQADVRDASAQILQSDSKTELAQDNAVAAQNGGGQQQQRLSQKELLDQAQTLVRPDAAASSDQALPSTSTKPTAQFINILPYRSDSINAPSEVLEEPSQAEDSEEKVQESKLAAGTAQQKAGAAGTKKPAGQNGAPHAKVEQEDGRGETGIYPRSIAKKYHFVEVYLKDVVKDDELIQALQEKPKRKNSLPRLLSKNYADGHMSGFGSFHHLPKEATPAVADDDFPEPPPNHSLEQQSLFQEEVRQRTTPKLQNVLAQHLPLTTRKATDGKFNVTQGESLLSVTQTTPQRQTQKFSQMSSKRNGSSVSGGRAVNNCPKCLGQSEKRPCEEWVAELRTDFTDYIDALFRKKMQEFIEFIEETVDVDDQIDTDKDHVIHAFYREHNTLQKMNENFRLLEYKRKKYIQKKQASNSKSPKRAQLLHQSADAGESASPVARNDDFTTAKALYNQTGLTPPQKNFLTTLYGTGSADNRANGGVGVGKFEQQSLQQAKTAVHGQRFQRLPYDAASAATADDNSTADAKQALFRSTQQAEPGSRSPQRRMVTNIITKTRQTSQPQMILQKNARRIAEAETNSSGTTQRRTTNGSNNTFDRRRYTADQHQQQQLPIISTRKAHLTVDQRVWDANQNYGNGGTSNHTNDLSHVITLKQALASNSSDLLNPIGTMPVLQEGPRVQSFNFEPIPQQLNSAREAHRHTMMINHQDSSVQNLASTAPQQATAFSGQQQASAVLPQPLAAAHIRGTRVPSMPLSVQFQGLGTPR